MVMAQLPFPARFAGAKRGSTSSSCGLLMSFHDASAPEGPAQQEEQTPLTQFFVLCAACNTHLHK